MWSARNCFVARAVCAGALSCWKMYPDGNKSSIYGTTVSCRSSIHASALMVLSTSTSSLAPWCEKQPQSMISPPPFCLRENKRFGIRLSCQLYANPSGLSKLKRFSWLHTILRHSDVGRVMWSRAHFLRALRWCSDSGCATFILY